MTGICGVVHTAAGSDGPDVSPIAKTMAAVLGQEKNQDHNGYNSSGISLIGVGTNVAAGPGEARIRSVAEGIVFEPDSLRAELGLGANSRGEQSTAIIPHAYGRWGPKFAERLHGEASIAVWDESRRRAVFTRDRGGVRSLYLAQAGDLLLFASELKAILASGLIPPQIDLEAIALFLSLGVIPAPATPVRGVTKLRAGERVIVDQHGTRTDRYWQFPEPASPLAHPDADQYAAHLIETLGTAVRVRAHGLRRPGVLLSGGLDSSIIAALLVESAASPVSTFTVGVAGSIRSNELAAARRCAKQLGTDHHELELTLGKREISIDELIWSLDEPIADLSAVGIAALCRLAAPIADAVFSGQGADGTMAGLPAQRTAALAAHLDWVPSLAKQALRRLFSHSSRRLRQGTAVLAARSPAERTIVAWGGASAHLHRLLAGGPLATAAESAAQRAINDLLGDASARAAGWHRLEAYNYIEAQLDADFVVRSNERAAKLGPLDIRLPFVDSRFTEFAATVPVNLKVRRLERKHLLRRAAADLVPAEVLAQPKVGFLQAALPGWLKHEADAAIRELFLESAPRCAALVNSAELERLVHMHPRDRDDEINTLLFSLVLLEAWLSTYLPRTTQRP